MPRKTLLLIIILLAGFGLWAWAAPQWTKPSKGREQVSAVQAPWVVMITASTGVGKMLCSGAHIAPNWVLTAAHCLTHLPILVQSAKQVELQRSSAAPSTLGKRYQAQMKGQSAWADRASAYPEAQGYNWDNMNQKFIPTDMALLHLETPLSSPTIRPGTPDNEVEDKSYSTWGYGVVSSNNESHIPLYRSAAQLQRCAEGENSWLCATANQDSNQETCQGDSGGPLTMSAAGKITIIGVISHGTGIKPPLSSCTPLGVSRWFGPQTFFAPVKGHLDWIRSITGVR